MGRHIFLHWLAPKELIGEYALLAKPASYLLNSEKEWECNLLVRARATIRGFATRYPTVGPGQVYIVPQVVLAVATQVTVGLAYVELAELQIRDREKQRVLGIIPNFYVSYVPDAVTLTSKQKLELAWKSSVDPFTFVAVGAIGDLHKQEMSPAATDKALEVTRSATAHLTATLL